MSEEEKQKQNEENSDDAQKASQTNVNDDEERVVYEEDESPEEKERRHLEARDKRRAERKALEEKEKRDVKERKKKKKEEMNFARKGKVQKTLTHLKKGSEEEEASKLANTLHIPYLDLNIFPIDQENVKFIEEDIAKELGIAVVHKLERSIKLVTTNPEEGKVRDFIAELEDDGMKVELFIVSQSSIERAWDEYGKENLVEILDTLRAGLTGEELAAFENDTKGVLDMDTKIRDLPVTKVLNMVLAGAIKLESSDIHFEPQQTSKVRLRFRIDGVLQTVASFPVHIYPTVVARVKVLGKMMINVRDIAQDGRFSVEREGQAPMDLRVSILPGNFGENIVVRLLSQNIDDLSLDKMGLEGLNYEWLINESEKKQGAIINSGPTGSGKTTTLYALINRLNSVDKKIISIENPIEYQVPGVSQTQIEERKGYTFESGLRAIMRQDPDIILVGEIRDEATAEIAIHASLTGHLVLSTTHANSATGVIGRFVDLGIKPNLIAPAINAFVAQRLLRRLCPHCKEEYKPASETIDMIKKMLALISPKADISIPKHIEKLWRPKGCHKCHGLGYKGRVGIFEILVISEEIKDEIERMSPEDEIRSVALENGMITLEQDGILKSVIGTTSIEELQRVVGKGEYLIDLYEKIVVQSLARGIFVKDEVLQAVDKIRDDYEAFEELYRKLPPKELIKYILIGAIYTGTGDIHIEPGMKQFKIRYRIDGALHDIALLAMNDYLTVLNEIKNLMGVKTGKREGVIDGRFKIMYTNKDKESGEESIDVRVSIILGGFGDVIVMRLLSQSVQVASLEKLNINEYNLEKIKRNVARPNGIIMDTGPTGSGKTTTLYSLLNYLKDPKLKLITIEDPIEYQMEGVLQTQVKEEEDYTFTTAMRVILRQDPDIVMVGEIRDSESANAAYRVALTGHLILTTLHANSAAGAVQRLLNMGISMSDLSTGTNCFIAQRLVRVLCPHCKKEKTVDSEEKKIIEKVLKGVSPKVTLDIPEKVEKIWEAVGCEECHNIGFKGRVAITEVLEIDRVMQKFLTMNPITVEIREKAIEEGMLTMGQEGILRVVRGETTIEEISHVIKEIDFVKVEKQIELKEEESATEEVVV
ncbi:type II/IV secretion system protein [bacterium]|jgi:type II secretory ATPase GspE/PulE/Tfp pilus assembly ATPase PilB-like protein|nr:type II/IV secretion system protein [bacterium]MBT4251639.1 type II/IV secretion system protein [bacterium]MBT4597688.1 type II/IV secretion system protein [bacterium]MBT6753701.1 type II/IV secretion system protein [bacterium]MBT7037838.1 type II/IV secretion system protein [bacterium]